MPKKTLDENSTLAVILDNAETDPLQYMIIRGHMYRFVIYKCEDCPYAQNLNTCHVEFGLEQLRRIPGMTEEKISKIRNVIKE